MLAADDDGDLVDPRGGQQFLRSDQRLPAEIVVAEGDDGAERRLRIDRSDRPLAAENRPDNGVAPAQAKLRAVLPLVGLQFRAEQRIEHELARKNERMLPYR